MNKTAVYNTDPRFWEEAARGCRLRPDGGPTIRALEGNVWVGDGSFAAELSVLLVHGLQGFLPSGYPIADDGEFEFWPVERPLIQERTRAGLSAARAPGRMGGSRPISVDDPRVQTAKRLHADKSMAIYAICQTLKICRPTLYQWLSMKPAVGSA
jgi:hypothetical protein